MAKKIDLYCGVCSHFSFVCFRGKGCCRGATDTRGAYWGIEAFPGFIHGGNFGYGQSYSIFEHFRRGYFVIETNGYGYVAMIPVALDTIGSVVFEDKWKQVTPSNPTPVYKGEKLGHFAYGGSLVIKLIELGYH